ncbi:hypothetical protein AKO1_005464, partial [Acrasis kona]
MLGEENTFNVTDDDGDDDQEDVIQKPKQKKGAKKRKQVEEPTQVVAKDVSSDDDDEILKLLSSDSEEESQPIKPSVKKKKTLIDVQKTKTVEYTEPTKPAKKRTESDKPKEVESDKEVEEELKKVTKPKKPTTKKTSYHETKKNEIDMTLFTASYVNSQLCHVPRKDESEVYISESAELCFMIKVTVPHPSFVQHVKPRVDIVKSTDGCDLHGYLKDERAPENSSSLKDLIFVPKILEKCIIPDVTLTESVRRLVNPTTKQAPQAIATSLSQKIIQNDDDDEDFTGISSQDELDLSIIELEPNTPLTSTPTSIVQDEIFVQEPQGKKRKTDQTAPNEPPPKKPKINFAQFLSTTTKQAPSKSTSTTFTLEYDLCLIVDQRERHQNDRNFFKEALSQHVKCESNQLSLGDVVWTAVHKKTKKSKLLNFIIERKAIDDLAGSIMDGRYKEQRFRLRECGMNCIMYLIEGDLKKNNRLPPTNLENALVRLLVSDGFLVHRTLSVDHTVRFLVEATKLICEILNREGLDKYLYKLKGDLVDFNNDCSKNKRILSCDQVFGRQLCCLPGVSAQIAETIVEKYKTPNQIYEAFTKEGGQLLSDLVIKSKFLGVAARKIGPACSENIYEMYTRKK